ncbi:MAG: hypothetical protein ACR2P8_08340 [Myxococcota bacterium]
MTDSEVLAALVELAGEAGLRIRTARGAVDAGPLATSGVCRLRGEMVIVLVLDDPLADRIAVVAAALREHAGAWLEDRWLPPALRAHL